MGTIISTFVDGLISASRLFLLKHLLVIDILTFLTWTSMPPHINRLFGLRRYNPPPRYIDLLYGTVPLMIHATACIGIIILHCIMRVPDVAPFVVTFMPSLLV